MQPRIILDTSVALKWYIKEVYQEKAYSILDEYQKGRLNIIVPTLFKLEMLNALLYAAISNRLTIRNAKESIQQLIELEINEKEIIINKKNLRLFDIASMYKISIYDSCYVYLAEQENCNFYTADRKLFLKINKDLLFVKWIEDFNDKIKDLLN